MRLSLAVRVQNPESFGPRLRARAADVDPAIRVALGARPRSIVTGVFAQAILQVSAGIVAGSALVALVGIGSVRQGLLLLAAIAVMLLVGVLACAVPLRRALAIQPTQALKAEA
jgi:putative ABC transport system permease protein